MANNGKLKMSGYNLDKIKEKYPYDYDTQFDKIMKAIAKRQRRKDREQKEKDRGKN